MIRILLTSTCFLFSLLLNAQQNDSIMVRKIADEILVNSKAYDNLHTLTKTVGARLSGSTGYYKAVQWGQKTLMDAGADKVYLQQCKIPHWVRGAKEEATLTVNGKSVPLNVLALGNSIGTGAGGITAPVIVVSNFTELDRRKDEVKGKIVFYNYKFNPRFVQTFRSYGDAVRYRGFGASAAAKYGAVAVLVRSMSHSTDNNPHTGAMRYMDSLAKIPALAVGLRDADKMADLLKDSRNATVSIKITRMLYPILLAIM